MTLEIKKCLKMLVVPLAFCGCFNADAMTDSKGAIIPIKNAQTNVLKKVILIYPNGFTEISQSQGNNAKISIDEQKGILNVEGEASKQYCFKIKSFVKPKNVTGADSWNYSQSSKILTINKKGKDFSIKIDDLKGYSVVKDGFPLVNKSITTAMYYDENDAKVVGISLKALQKDIEKISNKKPNVLAKTDWENLKADTAILVATANKTKLGKILAKKLPKVTEQLNGQWERYSISFVKDPLPGVKEAVVILGSDRRGTAYGVFELSKLIGVSPLVWWADVNPQRKGAIYLAKNNFVSQSPSVKYRGIFLNDEDWGLQPWAAEKMDTEVKDIGPKTYAKIFELMLRMKANFIWTAMHPCTKAFYYYKENPQVADDYAVVVGSSHCEPMLRNNVDEWKKNFKKEYGKKPGPWRYDTNSKEIHRYWNDRVKESANFESIYTVGMRGIHDGSMPGGKNEKDKIKLMDKVIEDQREMLNNISDNNAAKIPQIFCPYKEVLKLYQKGVKLPDDVTLVWADDNHGYIRKLSNSKEQKRSGGSGVYYHLSYWGYPADYLWLSTTSPSLISFEMSKAYAYNAKRLWVFNVGDIKPAEMEMQFAMDLAWNVKDWTPEDAFIYNYDWAAKTFGVVYANDIAKIKTEFYRLAVAARPEHSNKVKFTEQEMVQRLKDYEKLARTAEELEVKIPVYLQEAYYQLILYPVLGCKLMADKQLFARFANSTDPSSKSYVLYKEKSQNAFDSIKLLTSKYNNDIAGGKWNKMMDWKPRNQKVFFMPEFAASKNNIELNLSSAECASPMVFKDKKLFGDSKKQLELQDGGKAVIKFNSPKAQNLPLYALAKTPSKKEDSWFIGVNNSKQRIINEVDTSKKWKWVKLAYFKLQKGENKLVISQREPNAKIKAMSFGAPRSVLSKTSLDDSKKLYIAADKFKSKSDKLELIRGIGISGLGLTVKDINAKSAKENQIKDQPYVTFNVPEGFETAKVELRFVPSHAVNEEHKLRIAVQVKDLDWNFYNLNHKSKTRPWKENVLRGYSAVDFSIKDVKELKIAFPDPGLVLSEIVFSK